jgi:hypothetical protein
MVPLKVLLPPHLLLARKLSTQTGTFGITQSKGLPIALLLGGAGLAAGTTTKANQRYDSYSPSL